ncbi:MAG: histidine kinase [Bryobacterales bacterium]|nr:histidine kinase [Bryobacterales bacterium]
MYLQEDGLEASQTTMELAKLRRGALCGMDSGTAKARISPHQQKQALDQIRAHQLAHFLHELRNRLVAIRGYANLAVVSHSEKRRQALPTMLKNVLDNANELIALASRFDQCERVDLALEPVDVAQLAQNAIERCQGRASRQAVALEERVASRPIITFGDRRRIQAVLVQVLARSISAAGAGGRVDFKIATEGEEMSIQVSNGKTSNQVLDRLPGDKSSHSRADNLLGSGLIRDVVQLHGGWVSVASSSGKWRSTTLTLPLIQVSE